MAEAKAERLVIKGRHARRQTRAATSGVFQAQHPGTPLTLQPKTTTGIRA